eukprot:NODE_1745_length_857_cov_31.622525_g1375_i0.p1 GENE.NODE_1745_length_857_cov_31.622525_g1375_i0~~NODE_1745_length_857_cov_31.622525_g1375_i0.p1  ORF type:complete len:235 (-),score=71.86 NODE_1745_length_857_cov_31.622525_g1375_i0:153-797(-)
MYYVSPHNDHLLLVPPCRYVPVAERSLGLQLEGRRGGWDEHQGSDRITKKLEYDEDGGAANRGGIGTLRTIVPNGKGWADDRWFLTRVMQYNQQSAAPAAPKPATQSTDLPELHHRFDKLYDMDPAKASSNVKRRSTPSSASKPTNVPRSLPRSRSAAPPSGFKLQLWDRVQAMWCTVWAHLFSTGQQTYCVGEGDGSGAWGRNPQSNFSSRTR